MRFVFAEAVFKKSRLFFTYIPGNSGYLIFFAAVFTFTLSYDKILSYENAVRRKK